ncbi:unnamed protein product [Lota lota]
MVTSMSYKDHRRTEFRAGECVSLSCDGAPSSCFDVSWLFSYKNRQTETVFENGMFKSNNRRERLNVTKECSLEVKKLREEDEGFYTCRSFPSSGRPVDHAHHELTLIRAASTSKPATTTVKANTTCTRPSKPTTTTVKGLASTSTAARPSTSTATKNTLNAGPTTEPPSQALELGVKVALGTVALLIVALVLLICWHRRRGNKTPKETTTIGLNIIKDTLPVLGAVHDEHLSVDVDQDGGPTYASVVLPEGQRAVGTAQVEDDSSNAMTYASVRPAPRWAEKTGDVDIHYATVNKRIK